LYEVDHTDRYNSAGFDWPPSFDASFAAKTDWCLTRRRAEVLYLQELLFGKAADLTGIRVKDLNLSMNWGSEREDICPCIVSTSWIWIRGPVARKNRIEIVDRLLCGEEALGLQGFDRSLRRLAGDEKFSQRDLYDLAGNAFAGPCTIALVTALVACAPIADIFDIPRESSCDIPDDDENHGLAEENTESEVQSQPDLDVAHSLGALSSDVDMDLSGSDRESVQSEKP
jgi:hypothetical protein